MPKREECTVQYKRACTGSREKNTYKWVRGRERVGREIEIEEGERRKRDKAVSWLPKREECTLTV